MSTSYCRLVTPRTNMASDRRLFNVAIAGFALMLVFTAFQTIGNIEVSVENNLN
ncbi:hypothetical protein J6590_046604 [Homalodisca vitripennis]|nr:hypothetical protein J6590_046604 [Homalodisca vitripennis]